MNNPLPVEQSNNKSESNSLESNSLKSTQKITTLEDENELLKKINTLIKDKQLVINNESQFENMTIKTFINNITATLYKIINNISNINTSNIPDNPDKWWEKYIKIIEKILQIIFDKEHIIYIGFLILLLSILLYFIDISDYTEK